MYIVHGRIFLSTHFLAQVLFHMHGSSLIESMMYITDIISLQILKYKCFYREFQGSNGDDEYLNQLKYKGIYAKIVCSFQEGDITGIQIDEDNTSVKFAMSGKSWEIVRVHFPEQLQKVTKYMPVFSLR